MFHIVSVLISGVDEKDTDEETYLHEIGLLFGHHIQHNKNDVSQNSVAQCLKSWPHLTVVQPVNLRLCLDFPWATLRRLKTTLAAYGITIFPSELSMCSYEETLVCPESEL